MPKELSLKARDPDNHLKKKVNEIIHSCLTKQKGIIPIHCQLRYIQIMLIMKAHKESGYVKSKERKRL